MPIAADTRWSPPVVDGTGDSATSCNQLSSMPLHFGSVTPPHYGGQGKVPGSGAVVVVTDRERHGHAAAQSERAARAMPADARRGAVPRGRYLPCVLVWTPEDGDVPELRLLAPQEARCPTELWEGRPVQCTRVRVCMRGVRGARSARVSCRSARTVGVCVGPPGARRRSIVYRCVDRAWSCVRVPALGQSMVRDRCGTGAGVPMKHVCMLDPITTLGPAGICS